MRDVLSLDSLTRISDFQLRLDDVGSPVKTKESLETPAQMLLGLGPNSTLLTALKSAGRIASRSFAYSWRGRDGGQGSLVLGGYDANRTIGNKTTLPLRITSKCPTGLMIPDLALTVWPGALDPGAPSIISVSACLLPDSELFMATDSQAYTLMVNKLFEGGKSVVDRISTNINRGRSLLSTSLELISV